MTHQTLEILADWYNPFILFAVVVLIGLRSLHAHNKLSTIFQYVALLGFLMCWVFGGYWLDTTLALWAQLNSDYSTHTAFAAAVTYVLWLLARRSQIPWLAMLVGYCVLMRYLGYHTVFDMVSTLLYTSLGIALAWALLPLPKKQQMF